VTSAVARAGRPAAPRCSDETGWLLRRYARLHDPRDLDTLVRRFRPLARRLALRYARGAEPIDDLEQVANVGLVKALHRFDPAKGYAFTTFAVPTILGELKRSFRDTAWIAHVPRSVQERSARVREAADDLEHQLGRAPTAREIARTVGGTEEDVVEAISALGALASLSLDAPAHAEDAGPLVEQLGHPDDGYEHAEDLAAIEAALPALTDVQQTVLRLRFDEDLKQSEIARRLGVSQMQISRILRAALERLHAVASHQSRLPASARSPAGERHHSAPSSP
jgi:RNA polymerase sigma-B factor